jgi:hypothetical protein
MSHKFIVKNSQRTITCARLYTRVDGGGEKISLSRSFPLGEGGIHFRMNLNQRATQRSSTPNPATHPQSGMIYPRTTPITSRITPATIARVRLRFFDDLLSTMVFSLTLYSRSAPLFYAILMLTQEVNHSQSEPFSNGSCFGRSTIVSRLSANLRTLGVYGVS